MSEGRTLLGRQESRILWGLGLILGAVLSLFSVTRALDYPLSLVLSPTLGLLFLGWGAFSSTAVAPAHRARPWVVLVATWASTLVGPAVGSALTTICEPLYGMGFLLLGPLASGACGLVAGMAIQRWIKRTRWRILAICGLILGELGIVVAEFWFSPGVRFFGWLFGMYHGAIYDEAVRITSPYVWLRVKDLLWAGALYLWTSPLQPSPGPSDDESSATRRGTQPIARFTPWACLAGSFMLLAFSPWLRFTATELPVNQALSHNHVSRHFVLHATPAGKMRPLLPRLAEDLEYRLWQQDQLFQLAEPTDPIQIYVYESPQQKEALMGAGRTTVSKPWRREIHFHSVKPGESLVAHELAHVLLSQASDSMLAVPSKWGVLPKPGILEGAATAVERGGARMTGHGWAKAMREIGKRPDMTSILTGLSFWGHTGALAYTACGSFVRFLLEAYGPAPFATLYAGAEFSEAYQKPLPTLLEEWDRFLDSVEVAPGDLLLAEFLFTQPSVFQKTCPHAGARCLQEMMVAVRQQKADEAAGLAKRSLVLTQGDPRTGREVASLLLAANAVQQARDILGSDPGIDVEAAGKSLQISLHLWDLDTQWLLGKGRQAHDGYAELAQDTAVRTLLGPELTWRLLMSDKVTSKAMRRLLVAPILDKELEPLVSDLLADAAALPKLDQVALGRFLLGRPKWEEQAMALLSPLVESQAPEWLLKLTTGENPALSPAQGCSLYVELSLKLATAHIFRGELTDATALLQRLEQTSPAGTPMDQADAECIPPGVRETISDLQRRILWKRQYLEENQERTKQEE